MTIRIRAAIPIPIGSEELSAAEPARTRTNRISSVAYATEESGSEANTASAVALPRRSCRCCAVGSGVPTKSRLSRCRRTGPILLRAARLYLKRLRLPVGLRDVLEPRVLGQEHDLDRADGAVALLADDDVGDVGLVRREVLLVLRLAIEEQDQVGVLLQRPGVVADDSVGEPGRRAGHGEIEDLLLPGGLDGNDAIPEQIAGCARAKPVVIEDLGVLLQHGP